MPKQPVLFILALVCVVAGCSKPIQPLWQRSIDAKWVFPVYHDGNIFLEQEKTFSVLSAADGIERWSHDGYVEGVMDGVVLIDGLKGLNETDGSLLWEKDYPGLHEFCDLSPTAFVGKGIFGDYSVLTAKTGEVYQNVSATGANSGFATVDEILYGGISAARYRDNSLGAWNPYSGSPIWNTPTKTVYSQPAVSGPFVLALAQDRQDWDDFIYCLDKASGKMLWSWSTQGDAELAADQSDAFRVPFTFLSGPVFSGEEAIFIGSRKGVAKIFALNQADGKLLWSHKEKGAHKDDSPTALGTAPLIIGDQLFYAVADRLIWLAAATGEKMGERRLASPVRGICSDGKLLFIGTDNSQLLAVDPETLTP